MRPATNRLEYYYKLLDLPEHFGIKDIKTAFRKQAKAFHPDINTDPGAHERFIDINEAYTCLMDFHTRGKASAAPFKEEKSYRYWTEEERQRARERAAGRAKMKFEEFQRSHIYRTTSVMSHILDYLIFILGVFIIIASGYGLLTQGLLINDNGEDVLNIRGIIAGIVITTVGLVIILMSYENIKTFREKFNKPHD